MQRLRCNYLLTFWKVTNLCTYCIVGFCYWSEADERVLVVTVPRPDEGLKD